jgi:AAA+ superfamily predicted ATPase
MHVKKENTNPIDINTLQNEFDWVQSVVKNRLTHYFQGDEELKDFSAIKPPDFSDVDSPYYNFLLKNNISTLERFTLVLALIPHVLPDYFDDLILKNLGKTGDFPQLGGVRGKNHRGFLPTGETVIFLLAGKDMEYRFKIQEIFNEERFLMRTNVISLESVPDGEPKMSGRLIMDEEYIELFTTGKISKPKLSSDFPAELITTGLEWDDLVLQKKTLEEINEIEIWLKHNDTFLHDWEMNNKVKPGFRILFHGPPGTGKTMTACLLGKYTKRFVFRIDLSLVVSKYIGETEKNLAKLFNKAANKDWILFFDEADSVFGKRTNVRDAHDKYANQEVSYLLQRIESHPGLIILATNFIGNIDSSFTRRFNSMIEFENPGVAERLALWGNYLPEHTKLDPKISLNDLAQKYDLTGANIVNIIHYAGLKTLEKELTVIAYEDLKKGIHKEYLKEGKMIKNLD